MQRNLVVVLVLVLAVIGGALWWLSRGQVSVPPDPGSAASTGQTEATAEQSVVMAAARDEALRSTTREAVTSPAPKVLDDPEIVAALTGFKGRVVSHQKQPVPDAGVRIYRGAMDVVLQETVDLFAEEPTLVPQYVAGETRTAADGTFVISGVWPRAFYVMFAGIGTDAPMHQILSHTPSPGEVVDLGDIVLPDAGVIVGTVLDHDGDPLPGALVRAADLPGVLATIFPVERFDPEGAVLIREANSPIRVVEMPAWVKSAFEHLPIPSARSDSAGKFRLVGVTPGSNMLATTAPEHLSDVRPSVQVRAGQVKDVGNVKLKHGEELTGRVLDSEGKPVAGAEVLAGSTLQVPFDLARRLASSDAEGRFQGQGFAPGRVTVAARRGRGHAWVLAEPQAILGDVTVTLPSTHGVAVTVTLADGAPAVQARLKLLSGTAGDGAAEMAVLGFVPPVDLRDRLVTTGEGQWRIENLATAKYSLVADAPGHATAFQAFDIAGADASIALQLTAKKDFAVRVLSREDKPIRNAAIYAEAVGKAVFGMAIHCGRTNADGRLVVDKLQADTLRISADHPRWGVVHGEAKFGQELVLYMEPPGSLRGVLTEEGRPPELGKFTVVVMQEGGDGPRGPIEQVPTLVTARPDGSFSVLALQPGNYGVAVIKSLDALRSPGSLMLLGQTMMMEDELPSAQVRVHSGQTAEVRLDASKKPIEGPTGHLFGTVTIDGRLAAGHTVTCHGEEGRHFQAKVDETGRFDFGSVPAAKALQVNLAATVDGMMFAGSGAALWAGKVTLAAAEERELVIAVATSSVSGTCHLADGSVAAGAFVQARGRLKGAEGDQKEVWLGSSTDHQGRFHFAQVAEGTWTFEARSMGEHAGRGRLEGIAVAAGIPLDSLRIEMQKGITVKGRVDLTRLGDHKPDRCWIVFHRMPADGGDGVGEGADSAGFELDGSFSTDDLAPGRYRVRVHVAGEDEGREYRSDDIEVPPQGLDNLVLRIGEVVSR